MAHNVELHGVAYLSTHEAAKLVGYTSDYVSRLAREKKIEATRVGRQWFVNPISLENFCAIANREREARNKKLRTERKAERSKITAPTISNELEIIKNNQNGLQRTRAAAGAAGMVLAGVFAAVALYGVFTHGIQSQSLSMYSALEGVAKNVYTSLSLGVSRQHNASVVSSEDRVVAQSDERAERDGIVIMSSSTSPEEIRRIEESFSDEVDVSFDTPDSRSGVITPIFRERVGDQYKFLLVPVDEGS